MSHVLTVGHEALLGKHQVDRLNRPKVGDPNGPTARFVD